MTNHKQSNPDFPTKKKIFRGNIVDDIKMVCLLNSIDINLIKKKNSDQCIVAKRTKIIKLIKSKGFSMIDIAKYFNITPQAVVYMVNKK